MSSDLFQLANRGYLAAMRLSLKPYLPKSLFGRAALILLVPVIVVQLLVSVAFIQRHYDRVTVQLTSAVARDVQVLLPMLDVALAPGKQTDAARSLSRIFGIRMVAPNGPEDPVPTGDFRPIFDLAGLSILRTLRESLPDLIAVDLRGAPNTVKMYLKTPKGPIRLDIARGRFAPSNPHQLLVLMVFASVVMTLIAFVFMRNQLSPITRLAAAAAAFGRGQHVPYTPRGATEVRAAGQAFLAMRARIERQIESRTLMLSGVSHDLRSPLTRLKLGLALLPEDEDTRALLADIADMERLLDEFLAFARGDALEENVLADPAEVLRRVVAQRVRTAGAGGVKIGQVDGSEPSMMRPDAVARALDNLIGNAQRYGSQVEVSLQAFPESLRFVIEDNGPGIPQDQRLQAAEPFARLDAARNPNQGGGVGLGLAIATDIARSHGGELILGSSARLGGLRAELRIAR
jgi:two-component system osmolarity sensor histidine kinase EnvZ